MAGIAELRVDPAKGLLWLAILGACGWFLVENYTNFTPQQPGSTMLNRTIWYGGHIVVATPLLLLAPFQFSTRLRARRPRLHRRLGKTYLTLSIVAALFAVWLGATIQYDGSKIPLTLFALLWLFFSVAAWKCARGRDFVAHRRFVIRSFVIALAFVWIRLIGELADTLLFFIEDEEMVDATSEWLSFVLPLVAVEAWLSWWPAWKASGRRGSARQVAG